MEVLCYYSILCITALFILLKDRELCESEVTGDKDMGTQALPHPRKEDVLSMGLGGSNSPSPAHLWVVVGGLRENSID